MTECGHSHHDRDGAFAKSKAAKPGFLKFAYWIVGIGSMIWLLLRSGTRPRRLSYPCQRVAAANSVGFLAYLATLLGTATLFRRLKATLTPARLALFVVGLLLTATLQASVTAPTEPILADSPPLPGWTSATAVSDVFAITNVPAPAYSLDGGDIPSGVSADEALHDDGVDALVNLMEAKGDHFYQTSAHPDGLFASNDVVVIKVNNQWDGRNGTNTDVVKGTVYQLLNHPDGFTGAVIIAENTQNHNPDWYHQSSGNNSQFEDQSYLEVAQAFASQGHHVCISDWKSIRDTFVDDYDVGNDTNGYVLMDADGTTDELGYRRLSYPKFQVNCNGMNLKVSMQNGIWNDGSPGWWDTNLKLINMPVLKRHGATGSTITLKNYIGFITTAGSGRWISPGLIHCWLLSTPTGDGGSCTSYTQEYGLVARQMARVRRADLEIVDSIWANPRDNVGYYENARRLDVILASRDPFAVDYYTSVYILGPLIQTYEPSLDHTQSMASTPGGLFRIFLMRNVARLRMEGITNTINIDDSMTTQQELNQFNVYVADANAPVAPTLTLQQPNGGETWPIGTQEQITWSSTNLAGDVALEYSTDGFASSTVIAASTDNNGAYAWIIPDDPSTNVLVRVSSALTTTISDASDAVFTIAAVPLTPTLTLQSPNGGEVWIVGTQQQIEWSSTNLEGEVQLEYSTNGFASSTVITSSTANDGAYGWNIPVDLSTNVLVRVSSVLSSTISDTSDAAFTIAGPYTFDDSYKTVSHRDLEGGERITYTIVLYEAVSATMTLTDAIPAPLTYVPGSANVEPSGTVEFPGYIFWSGTVSGIVPVTITFQTDVPDVGTSVVPITNRALVSRNGTPSEELTVRSIINGFHVYLPMVLRSY